MIFCSGSNYQKRKEAEDSIPKRVHNPESKGLFYLLLVEPERVMRQATDINVKILAL